MDKTALAKIEEPEGLIGQTGRERLLEKLEGLKQTSQTAAQVQRREKAEKELAGILQHLAWEKFGLDRAQLAEFSPEELLELAKLLEDACGKKKFLLRLAACSVFLPAAGAIVLAFSVDPILILLAVVLGVLGMGASTAILDCSTLSYLRNLRVCTDSLPGGRFPLDAIQKSLQKPDEKTGEKKDA